MGALPLIGGVSRRVRPPPERTPVTVSANLTCRLRTAAAAAVLSAATALPIAAATPAAHAAATARVDNPFVGAGVYLNPEWSAHAAAEPGGSAISTQPTAVWMDRIAAITGGNGVMGLRDHLNAAVQQAAGKPYVFQVVIYDLPGRDCSALASNGELGPTELPRYKSEFIDPIAAILADPAYANLRIVTTVEIDSLPNLVTNAGGTATATPACDTMKANGNYVNGVGYALAKLGAIPNVYNYVDAGHHGWLGWDSNLQPAIDVIKQAATASGSTVNNVQGFITNTANYSALHEPHFTVGDSVNGTSVRQSKWVDWNNYVDEATYAKAFRTKAVASGFNANVGMLIDTSRNGWGGSSRPAGPGPTTSVDAYVDGGRIDRRFQTGNWCNQSGAGLGERPKAAPEDGIAAYVWVKPPGESDGASSAIPNNEGKGFDRMCDPTYTGNPRNNNNMSGALPGAPLAGHWFSAQFQELLKNAYPALGPSTGDTTPPTAPTGLAATTTAGSVSLTWNAATDNVGVTGYDVYRGGVLIGSTAGTSYTETGLTASTAYSYTVKARDAAGNVSAASAALVATTQASGGGTGAGCTASYKVTNDWGAGFNADVTVTAGNAAIKTWKVTWNFGGNQQITNLWNGQLAQSGPAVTVTNLAYNGTVAAGASTAFGFGANYSGSNATPTLTCTATS
ncbi:glycoside hydrolase family 6 protein [Kitasatospora sp. NPDC004614]|uniref:glycoside hydrolase family 6 protein n=1 Tax=unclassified Kitasatospora TaxID=2633591 RepID=UPI0036997769